MNLEIIDMRKTCGACPSQWEGHLKDGRMFYIRYRGGRLSLAVSEFPTDNVYDAVGGTLIYRGKIGDDLDGVIGYNQVKAILELNNVFLVGGESE